ncbi:MAG: CsgG/HfaB family protein [Treponema sp.]|jgi:TolB-like protein|nr:CsgG/HfaB family protein [Treponema sp.]
MKKRMFLCIFACFLPMFAFTQTAVTIDAALNNSTSYLSGRIPAKTKVVVLNFSSNWPQLSEYIIEELIGYIVNEGSLTVVDRQNLETIRKEMDFQLSGEVSDETAQSIGKKLGAQTIISGAITAIGNAYRLRIRAISVETAQILGMQNVDVAQDSRLAALTGTAYAGPATNASSPRPAAPAASPGSSNAGYAAWQLNFDPQSSAQLNSNREYIDGQEREVWTLNVNLAKGDGVWAGMFSSNETFIQKLKAGSGVRYKVLGDGKSWTFGFRMSDTESNYHRITVSTRNGKTVEVDVPYSKLKQPEWGKKAAFNKSRITGMNLEKMGANGSGPSTIKIFDFEVY